MARTRAADFDDKRRSILDGAAAVYAPTTGLIYFFGGVEQTGGNPQYRFYPFTVDPKTGATALVNLLISGLYKPQAVWDGNTGNIILLGGTNGDGTPSKAVTRPWP